MLPCPGCACYGTYFTKKFSNASKKAAEVYLGLVQKEIEDIGGMVICPSGEE